MKKLLIFVLSITLLSTTAFSAKKMGVRTVRGATVFGQNYVPRDANIFGFINLKAILQNSVIKNIAELSKLDQKLAKAKLTRGDLKTVVGFAKVDDFKFSPTNVPKAAIIFQGINAVKTLFAKKMAKMQTITHKGALIYKNSTGSKFVTVSKGHSILGTESGVKSALDARLGKGVKGVNNRLKKVLSKLNNPVVAVAFGVSQKLIDRVKPQLDNPQISAQLPALKDFIGHTKALALGGSLKGKMATAQLVVTSLAKDVKAMVTSLIAMKNQMKPMLPSMLQAVRQKSGEKVANMMMNAYNSLQFRAEGNSLLVSFSLDLSAFSKKEIQQILKGL